MPEDTETRLAEFRRGAGIHGWDGDQGDLILGRHTWKEYVRGLHEGWLGPLAEPKAQEMPSSAALSQEETGASPPPWQRAAPSDTGSLQLDKSPDLQDNLSPESTRVQPSIQRSSNSPPEIEKPPDKPPAKPAPIPPYIRPEAYLTASSTVLIPSSLQPATVVPFPHLLGFLNTPIRIYRFLTKRYLADETGELVATLVLNSNTRNFDRGKEFYCNVGHDEEASVSPQSSESTEIGKASTAWEQESVLVNEEREWHKSARAPNPEENLDRERPWMEKMIIDNRVGDCMRTFELTAEEKAQRLKGAEAEMEKENRERGSRMERLLIWLGLKEGNGVVRGWEHGLVDRDEE